jgi:predicted HicB family RNase H-like nuclease
MLMATATKRRGRPPVGKNSMYCKQDVRMDSELYDRVSTEAGRKELSVSEYIRQVLADHLERSLSR